MNNTNVQGSWNTQEFEMGWVDRKVDWLEQSDSKDPFLTFHTFLPLPLEWDNNVILWRNEAGEMLGMRKQNVRQKNVEIFEYPFKKQLGMWLFFPEDF